MWQLTALSNKVLYASCIHLLTSKIKSLVLNKFKENEMGRACSTNGEKRSAYKILVGKPEGKRPLGRPRRRRVANIKMDLRDIG
jgi:hypothetical protein